MLISTTQAAALLADQGLSRERTRLLLESGVAGAPSPTPGAVMYDDARVAELATWPYVDEATLADACPRGLIVARLGPHRQLDLSLDPASQRRSLSEGWRPSRAPRLLVFSRSTLGVRTPFVATVSGYVLLGAEVAGMEHDGSGGCRLVLDEPGEWYEALRGRRWFPGRGGPAMLLWGWPPRRAHPSSSSASISSSALRA